jgi:peptidoglycan/LPS O-acetylase OafA/YrhL
METPPVQPLNLHLPHLDGLRALAALYVMFFHSVVGFSDARLGGPWHLVRRAFSFGHEAVAIFIVLSGYCLMLPILGKQPDKLATPFGRFMRRRAIRILPPYAAALVLSLALIATWAPLRVDHTGTIWDDSLPALTPGAIVSHVLLVHNWSPDWVFQINGPLWSVATEWQIYFFFPLLLLPVWRRAGMFGGLLALSLVGYAPVLFAPSASAQASPWYLTLFACGAIAAALGFRRAPAVASSRLPWGLLAALAWGGCVLFVVCATKFWFRHKPVSDALLGVATAALLVHLAVRRSGPPEARGRLLGLLESRWLTGLGRFSYSLYLTHLPLIALAAVFVRELGLEPVPRAVLLVSVTAPACIAFAYLFYTVAERPFILRRELGGRASDARLAPVPQALDQ